VETSGCRRGGKRKRRKKGGEGIKIKGGKGGGKGGGAYGREIEEKKGRGDESWDRELKERGDREAAVVKG